MYELEKVIPSKYLGKDDAQVSKLFRPFLFLKFNIEISKKYKKFISVYKNKNVINDDSKKLDNEIFNVDNFDQIYSKYELERPNQKELENIIYNLECIKYINLYAIVDFANRNNIKNITPTDYILFINIFNSVKMNIQKVIDVSIRKNLSNIIKYIADHLEYINNNLELYYKNIKNISEE